MNKAVFADLDDTLVKTKSGEKIPKDRNDWVLDLTVLDAIYNYMFKHLSGTLCIVTNQGGVEDEVITREDVTVKLENVRKAIYDYYMKKYNYNVKVDSGASYTNDPTDFMRKPNPGLGYHLAIQNNLILAKCVMVGNADVDEAFANNCIMNHFDVESFVMFYSPHDV